jgi:hypothetical protein
MKILRSGIISTLLFGLTFALAMSAAPQSGQPVSSDQGATGAASSTGGQVSAEEQRKRNDWNEGMLRKAAPKHGCFKVEYPSTDWKEVACGKGKQVPALPRHGVRAAVVGNNNDISAHAPSGTISQTIGTFDTVNVTSESGLVNNVGSPVADAYSLQINTNFMNGVCSGSPNTGCQGWEQFVFTNDGTTGNLGKVFIQYWLIKYNATCPAGQNWNQFQFTGGTDIYCYKDALDSSNGFFTQVPSQPISNLANLKMSAAVTPTSDSVTLSTSSTSMYNRTGDNAVNAAAAWTSSEWNVFGDAGSSAGGGTANFNAGASVVPRTRIIYGSRGAPDCLAQGTTGEKNNFSFGPNPPTASGAGPAVIFSESIAGGATSNCAAAATIGDTHLRTFNGLFYDFQASGDFTLAEVGKEFAVQTRQVSGAPTWPNATVNKAVAARFGSTEVAVCLASPGREGGAGVHVDGKFTAVADGQTLELPEGVGIARLGNVYQITSESGDSVRATVNPTWIDVAVGLGKWPSAVRGLIANPNGNVNEIATRDGAVLTSPFRFDDLYHRFADSWRVSGETSMLSVCGRSLEASAPQRAFFASDLDGGLREKAQGVCKAAGVKAGPLLEACTLDVAVIGDDAAAKVFVDLLPPVAIGTITGGGGGLFGMGGGIFGSWWWLWLLLLLLILLLLWWLLRRKH